MSIDVTVTTDPIELTIVEDNTTVEISDIETISLTISQTGPAGPPGIPGGNAVISVNGKDGDVVLDTDDISEGTKKYNVQSDWDASSGLAEILNKPESSDDIIEGITNLYHVNADWTASAGVSAILNKPLYFPSAPPPESASGEVIFAHEGAWESNANFIFDIATGKVQVNSAIGIGDNVEYLPNNPLALQGEVDSYLQVNLRNTSTHVDATSDYIVTADDGDDSHFFGDFGIANSLYASEVWSNIVPHDAYLYVDGGNLVLGTLTVGKNLQFFISETDHESVPTDTVMTISATGVDLRADSEYSIDGVALPLMSDVSRVELQNIECHGAGFVLAMGVVPTGVGMGFYVLPYICYVSNGTNSITRVYREAPLYVDALGDPLVTLYDGLNIICIGADNQVHIFNTQPDLSLYPLLAVIYTAGMNTILAELVNTPAYCGEIAERMTAFVSDAIHALVISGCALAEGATPFTLSAAAGYVTINLQKYTFALTTNFYKMYYDAIIGWTINTDMSTWDKVNPELWNDMTQSSYSQPAGTPLATIPTGKWSKSLVYRSPNGIMYQVYAQYYYDNEDDAKAAALPTIPPGFEVICIFIATIVAKEDDTSIGSRIQDIRPYLPRIFGYGAASSGVSLSHAALLGLSADDHKLYYNETRGDLRYAQLADGVTGGNSHDHSGGDGAQISYTTLGYTPTLGTAAAENVGYFAVAAHGHEGSAIISTGEIGGTKFLREDGDGTSSWQAVAVADHGHEGTAIVSTGETGGTKFLREDGDGTSSWQAVAVAAHGHEGSAIISTGETGGTKFLREDGDGTSSWQAVPAWSGSIADINLDGGTDIGAALADADLILVDDGGGGTNRKSAMSRVKTYIGAATTSTKLDDFATPDDNTDLNANTTNHGLVVKAVAPAANVLNVVGIANAETAYTVKSLFDATNPQPPGTATPGTSLIASHRDHVHATDTTKLDAVRGNWKLFHSNGTGVFSEIALGAAGTFLKGMGASAAPEFAAITVNGVAPVYNVKDYGAIGNGTADDTTAIRDALTASAGDRGCIIYFPSGVYKTTGTITVNRNSVTFMGPGAGAATIYPTSTNVPVFQLTAGNEFITFRDMEFFAGATQVSGSSFIYTNGAHDILIDRVSFAGWWKGVYIGPSTTPSLKVVISNSLFNSGVADNGVGIFMDNGLGGDTYIGPWVVMSHNPALQPLAGIQILSSGHFSIAHCNITSCLYGLYLAPKVSADVQYGFVHESLFDSCAIFGAYLYAPNQTPGRLRSIKFTGCWFSGAGHGVTLYGASTGVIDDISFTDCRVLNNLSNGIWYRFGTNVRISGCTITGNSQTTNNSYDGINILAGISDFEIIGNRIGMAGTATNTQKYAINVASGASDRYQIMGNDVGGNGTAPYINDLGTGVFKSVFGNSGMIAPSLMPALTAAEQVLTASSVNQLTGSKIQLPVNGLVIGTRFIWHIGIRKPTLAGVATWSVMVRFGTAGTTSDGVIATFTSNTNSALVDQAMLRIVCDILTLGGSATARCNAQYVNRLQQLTGLGEIAGAPNSTATFNSASSPAYISVTITPGASAVMNVVCDAQIVSPAW